MKGIINNDYPNSINPEELYEFLDGLELKEKPFSAYFGCKNRGVVDMGKDNFIPCKNKECSICNKYKETLNKQLNNGFNKNL